MFDCIYYPDVSQTLAVTSVIHLKIESSLTWDPPTLCRKWLFHQLLLQAVGWALEEQ